MELFLQSHHSSSNLEPQRVNHNAQDNGCLDSEINLVLLHFTG